MHYYKKKVEIMNKLWKKSVIGTLCAGGLYAGILYNVQDQVSAANVQKNAYLQKVQERNHLIKKLNNYNQKLYQLQLTYNQTVNDTNQKSQQINALNSEIAQIKNQIAAMSVRSSSASSANTSSSTSSTTTQAPTAVKPSTPAPVVTPKPTPAPPPPVHSVTKAS
jgi:septal ring factor EnvC (AmiA/AmiB activator)